jgi:hypothetical protein
MFLSSGIRSGPPHLMRGRIVDGDAGVAALTNTARCAHEMASRVASSNLVLPVRCSTAAPPRRRRRRRAARPSPCRRACATPAMHVHATSSTSDDVRGRQTLTEQGRRDPRLTERRGCRAASRVLRYTIRRRGGTPSGTIIVAAHQPLAPTTRRPQASYRKARYDRSKSHLCQAPARDGAEGPRQAARSSSRRAAPARSSTGRRPRRAPPRSATTRTPTIRSTSSRLRTSPATALADRRRSQRAQPRRAGRSREPRAL